MCVEYLYTWGSTYPEWEEWPVEITFTEPPDDYPWFVETPEGDIIPAEEAEPSPPLGE